MSENTAEIHVGRLLEIRIRKGFGSSDDLDDHYARLQEVFGGFGDGQVVIVADWRQTKIMSPEAAQGMRRVLSDFNQRIERSAVIASQDAPTAVLQFVRLIREGGHPERKLFMEPAPLIEFLDEKLTPAESERVRQFLGV